MYCENCGKNYANVKYTQVINGSKREMFLCEECSKILGIINFDIPMDFSTFLGNLFTPIEDDDILPQLLNRQELKCKRCNYTFEDFINTGRFGCPECYETFEERISPLLRRIQGADKHIGRLGKIEKEASNAPKSFENEEKENSKDNEILRQKEELNRKLKMAIKEEKYEEAANLRDKIKELEGEK